MNMEKIIVRGGNKLTGSVKVEGAKNAVLPVIAASILAEEGKSVIKDVPVLADVYTINEVLRNMNADVDFENNTVVVDATDQLKTEAPFEYVRKMRASVLVLGPLLARYGHANVAMPGGCAIGSRPIDLHLKGFEAMGANVTVGNGFVEVEATGRLQGAKIYLDMPSVGATENIMMAAALAEGKTVIENCAKEPEIVDLANFLNKMGARVVGAGTETIKIEGVESLHGVEHSIIPDRVEAGTFMVAAAITGGDIFIENAVHEHLRSVISKLEEMNVKVMEEGSGLRILAPEPRSEERRVGKEWRSKRDWSSDVCSSDLKFTWRRTLHYPRPCRSGYIYGSSCYYRRRHLYRECCSRTFTFRYFQVGRNERESDGRREWTSHSCT